MDRGEEQVEVVRVGVVVTVMEAEIFNGIGSEGGGAKHGDGGLMSPRGKSVDVEGRSSCFIGVFMSPL